MRHRQHNRQAAAQPSSWRSGRLLAVLAAGAVIGLALLGGLVLVVVTGPTGGTPHGAGTAPVPQPPATAVDGEDALAAAPMPSADPGDARPGPLSTRVAAPLELPRPTGTGAAQVPSGFPHTSAGALAQLAALDVTAMQTGSLDGVRQVITNWAAAGGPNAQTWSGVRGMADLLSAAGLSGAGSPQLAIAVRPVMGLIKGTVGPDFAVVCVDLEFAVTVAQTSRLAVADCQRMAWIGARWLIGPGEEPAPAPSVWPGTEAAISVGYRELRYA